LIEFDLEVVLLFEEPIQNVGPLLLSEGIQHAGCEIEIGLGICDASRVWVHRFVSAPRLDVVPFLSTRSERWWIIVFEFQTTGRVLSRELSDVDIHSVSNILRADGPCLVMDFRIVADTTLHLDFELSEFALDVVKRLDALVGALHEIYYAKGQAALTSSGPEELHEL
jgi:hypothetical protein